MTRHILALGGGGFSMEPDNPALDDFALSLTGKSRPKVCFLPTASGDAESYQAAFIDAFPESRAQASVLTLFDREIADVAGFLAEQDVIYVGGGNTANMLLIWRIHGVDKALRAAYQQGTILVGISAGMLCWFEASITDSFLAGHADPLYDGLGILPGSACPHFDSETARRPRYHELVNVGFPGGHAADDFAALHFVDEELAEAVASRPDRYGYRIEKVGQDVVETRLPTRLLTATEQADTRVS